jgi:hypothetical protein
VREPMPSLATRRERRRERTPGPSDAGDRSSMTSGG